MFGLVDEKLVWGAEPAENRVRRKVNSKQENKQANNSENKTVVFGSKTTFTQIQEPLYIYMYFMNASTGVPDERNLLCSIRELPALYKDSIRTRIYV